MTDINKLVDEILPKRCNHFANMNGQEYYTDYDEGWNNAREAMYFNLKLAIPSKLVPTEEVEKKLRESYDQGLKDGRKENGLQT